MLQLLIGSRRNLITDRVRLFNRLRGLLAGTCPVLEQAFNYSAAKGQIVILPECQVPTLLWQISGERPMTWLER
ncbi:hypothetical protein [Streptomyces murinus]|uniref:hypothetical protein n=1 Tax=Streptomyces murinus TaxID=33900 RepID=UPI0038027E31